ncbi:hypothetical protein KAMFAM_18 [Bacillus phage Kamfam]|nr:hypothetical protein OTK52_16 [Bacillus phage OTooleKemple52]AXQ67293.1 hypothetical protein KAMFAM_18 [Bacillus phage Kamfam]
MVDSKGLRELEVKFKGEEKEYIVQVETTNSVHIAIGTLHKLDEATTNLELLDGEEVLHAKLIPDSFDNFVKLMMINEMRGLSLNMPHELQ